jgi:molybdopterin-guanine dinucleotide biosynthesis protein MobB
VAPESRRGAWGNFWARASPDGLAAASDRDRRSPGQWQDHVDRTIDPRDSRPRPHGFDVKHTHHHHIEFDTPGKDSYRHRVAGASEVIVASDTGWARIATSSEAASLADLLGQLRAVDVVLVEGFKQLESLRRVEVFRGPGAPLAASDSGIAAVATPAGVSIAGFNGPQLPLDDTAAILKFILSN